MNIFELAELQAIREGKGKDLQIIFQRAISIRDYIIKHKKEG